MRKAILSLFGIVMMLFAVPTLAQDADIPEEVDFALLALNTDINANLTYADLESYVWAEFQFADASLGCPQDGQVYAQALTNGYQVLFTYEGVTYDYRIESDSETAFLCTSSTGTIPLDGAPPVQTVQPVEPVESVQPVQPTPIQPVTECPEGLPLRLALGETARTTPQLGSNIRAEADINAEDLGTIQPSDTFAVVDGPVCGNDIVWWQVDYNGLVGWTAQGQNGLYYVEPIPAPLPTTQQAIVFENVDNVLPLTAIEGNLLGEVSWSPDGTTVAIADASTENPAVWLYSTADLTQPPLLIEVDFDTTAMAFSPDGTMLAIGDPDGNIYFVNMQTLAIENTIVAHDTAVLDIDFSPDGRYMVSVDDNYSARFFGVPTP